MKDENEKTDFQDLIDELESDNYTEINAKIYKRDRNDNATTGRPPTGEFLQRVNFIVDDSYLAETFGPGYYTVKYRLKKEGEKVKDTTRKFTISPDAITANTPKKQAPQMAGNVPSTGIMEYGQKILNGLTLDKITLIGTAIKTIKEFLTPPQQPPLDLVKLVELVQVMNKPTQPALSDQIVLKAMEGVQKQQAGPDIFKQFEMIEKLKDLVKEKETTKENGDTMEYIKLAMQFLPQLLQKKNGNFAAVGAEVKENAIIKKLIADNPDLTRQFFDTAVKTYGPENASKLARGFGYNAEFVPGMSQEETEEETEENPGEVPESVG